MFSVHTVCSLVRGLSFIFQMLTKKIGKTTEKAGRFRHFSWTITRMPSVEGYV